MSAIRPILFSAPMVRAILTGTKSQTRRVVKPQPLQAVPTHDDGIWNGGMIDKCTVRYFGCPYGQPGDRLWLKENHFLTPPYWTDRQSDYNVYDPDGNGRIAGYVATMDPEAIRCAYDYKLRLRPSIHMPRWASRLTLEIVSVRVERVQEIGEADALSEGITIPVSEHGNVLMRVTGDHPPCRYDAKHGVVIAHFASLWDSINAARGFSWESNPWVWVVEFKRVEQKEAA